MIQMLRSTLAALTAASGLAVAAHAQAPAQPQPQPQPTAAKPQVIRWNGGYVVVDGPGVIVRQNGNGSSTNVVTGSGNGVGNRIVVDNGPDGGVTIVQNSRNGIGNKVVVNPDDLLIDMPDLPFDPFAPVIVPKPQPKVAPADPVLKPGPIPPAQPMVAPAPAPAPELMYKGKANTFWTKKAFSETHDYNLYWSPADQRWFRYSKDDDTYRPVLDGPEAPKD